MCSLPGTTDERDLHPCRDCRRGAGRRRRDHLGAATAPLARNRRWPGSCSSRWCPISACRCSSLLGVRRRGTGYPPVRFAPEPRRPRPRCTPSTTCCAARAARRPRRPPADAGNRAAGGPRQRRGAGRRGRSTSLDISLYRLDPDPTARPSWRGSSPRSGAGCGCG